jgi:hypothetical protein
MLTIISFSEQNITDVVGWAGSLVGDLMPLLVVIIGIAIGGYVIKVILHLRG